MEKGARAKLVNLKVTCQNKQMMYTKIGNKEI